MFILFQMLEWLKALGVWLKALMIMEYDLLVMIVEGLQQ